MTGQLEALYNGRLGTQGLRKEKLSQPRRSCALRKGSLTSKLARVPSKGRAAWMSKHRKIALTQP
eukprot:1160576-Pelagomonas_calceolata.AAC.2